MSIMNIIKHIPNRFTRLLDSTGQVVILYNRNGDLIVPNCLNLNKVEVLEDTSKCYNDFPVRLTLNNKSVIGFLTEDNIIQEYSKIVDCDTANKSLYFPTLNMRIIKIGSRTFKKYEVNRKTKLNYKQKNFAKLNFHHSSLVVNGVNTISEFLKLTQITEKDEVLVVEHDKSNDSSDYSTKTEHKRSNFLNNLLKSILIITSIGISISCLILLLIFFKPIMTCLNTCRNKLFKKRTPAITYNNKEQTVMIEMQPLNEPQTANQTSDSNPEVLELITRLTKD